MITRVFKTSVNVYGIRLLLSAHRLNGLIVYRVDIFDEKLRKIHTRQNLYNYYEAHKTYQTELYLYQAVDSKNKKGMKKLNELKSK